MTYLHFYQLYYFDIRQVNRKMENMSKSLKAYEKMNMKSLFLGVVLFIMPGVFKV